jgi:small subunit ribosomal protein S20
MPHTRSAKKNVRKTEQRRLRTRAVKSAIKTHIKKFEQIVSTGPADQAQAEFKLTIRKLDKAAAKRVIHPNQAARKKSQLAKLLQGKTKPAAPAS